MSLLDATRLGFRRCGQNVRIYSGAKIVGAEFITLGDNVIIDDFVFIYAHAPTTIGSHVHIASFCSITGGGELRMGDFSGLSSGVRVVTGSDDFLGGGLTNPTIPAEFRKVSRDHVHIGRHAIIGSNAVLLPRSSVGEGSAVGAGSLVNRDLAPWGIYVGSPARRIRERPSAQILAQEAALQIAHPFQRIA
jgi:acetyltransferase-like isoleucine patch superfamily enzyme